MTEKKFSLYSISERLEEINLEIQMNGGEMSDELEQALSDLSIELSTKTDSVIDFIKRETARIEERKQRIKEITEYNKAKINKLDSFKNYVGMCMDRLSEKKLEGTFGSITKRKPTQKVEIFDQEKVPTEYVEETIVKKVDAATIKKQLQAGHTIEGAKLIEGKVSLLIK